MTDFLMIQRLEKLEDFLANIEALFDDGRLDRARAELARARQIFPDSAVLHEWEAIFASEDGRLRDALEFLDQALTIDPERRFAMREKSGVLLELGRFEDCLELLQKLGSDGPSDAAHFYHLASCEDRLGRFAEADAHFARAVGINSRDHLMPLRMARHPFEELVRRALDGLPKSVREVLVRAHIVVEDYPGPRDFDPFLLGIYSPAPGYQQPQSDDETAAYLTLFKRNLELEFPQEDQLESGIRQMVSREVAQRHGLQGEFAFGIDFDDDLDSDADDDDVMSEE